MPESLDRNPRDKVAISRASLAPTTEGDKIKKAKSLRRYIDELGILQAKNLNNSTVINLRAKQKKTI